MRPITLVGSAGLTPVVMRLFIPYAQCELRRVSWGRLTSNYHFAVCPMEDNQTLVYTDVTANYGIWTKLAAPMIRWYSQSIIDQDIVALGDQMKVIEKYGAKFANTPADTIHAYVETIQREIELGNPRALPEKSAQ